MANTRIRPAIPEEADFLTRIVGEIPSETVPGRALLLMELALDPPENTTISSEN